MSNKNLKQIYTIYFIHDRYLLKKKIEIEMLYDSELLMKRNETNDCDRGDFWNGQCSKNKDFKDYQTINDKYFTVEDDNGDDEELN